MTPKKRIDGEQPFKNCTFSQKDREVATQKLKVSKNMGSAQRARWKWERARSMTQRGKEPLITMVVPKALRNSGANYEVTEGSE